MRTPRYCVRAWQPWERREGRLRIVFHAHAGETAVHPRYMVISQVDFTPEGIMVISDDFLIPQM